MGSMEKCWYTAPPLVVGSKNCGSKICQGLMSCSFNDVVYSDLKIFCGAKKGKWVSSMGFAGMNYNCPKPDECIKLSISDQFFYGPANNYKDLGGIVEVGVKQEEGGEIDGSSDGSAPVGQGDSGIVR